MENWIDTYFEAQIKIKGIEKAAGLTKEQIYKLRNRKSSLAAKLEFLFNSGLISIMPTPKGPDLNVSRRSWEEYVKAHPFQESEDFNAPGGFVHHLTLQLEEQANGTTGKKK